MQITNKELVNDLLMIVERAITSAENFRRLSIQQLNFRRSENEWSILECLEHLNLYGDFYLPEIEKQILSKNRVSENSIFKSGLIGNYFANLMQVKNGKIKKLKSPKDKNPMHSQLTNSTIERFIKQLDRLKIHLSQAGNVDLTKTKTTISLSKLIKLRLGDTLRFFVFHIERHVMQAERVAAIIKVDRKMKKVELV